MPEPVAEYVDGLLGFLQPEEEADELQPSLDLLGRRGQQLAIDGQGVGPTVAGREQVGPLEQQLGGRFLARGERRRAPASRLEMVSWKPLNAKVMPPPTGTR